MNAFAYTGQMERERQQISIAEAKEIQAEWMALECGAPEAEKQRVYRLMEKLPRSYIAQAPNGLAQLMIQGMPAHAFPEQIAECVRRAALAGIQTALRWSTKGEWIGTESEARA